MDDTELSSGLGALIEQHKQMLREVKRVIGKQNRDEGGIRRNINGQIARLPDLASVKRADLVLVKESNSKISMKKTKGSPNTKRGQGHGRYPESHKKVPLLKSLGRVDKFVAAE